MGWTAYYQILRDRPLDDAEVGKLYDFIRRTNRKPWEGEDFSLSVTRDARPDRVLAHGWQKFPLADESADQERLCEVLTALSKLIDDVEVRVADDFECFGWDEDRGEAAMDGPTTPLVSVADWDVFVDPAKLVGPRPEPLPKAVEGFLRGGKATRKTVAAALVEHANMETSDARRAALGEALRATPVLVRVQAGFDALAAISAKPETWQIVAEALASQPDVATFVDDFLAVWTKSRGVYGYDEILRVLGDTTLDLLARVPAVEQQMLGDLRAGRFEDEPDLTYRRAEAAAQLLGRGGSRRALLTLIETARDIRPNVRAMGLRHHMMPGIVAALRRFDVQEIVPTLLHELASGTSGHDRSASLVTLARLAPSRVMPIIEHLVATGEARWNTIAALEIIGGDAAIAALRQSCEVPDVHDRERAAGALRALGVEPPQVAAVPSAEALVTHVNRDVRYAALRELDERADRATVLSFLAAAMLDNALAKRFDHPVWSWKMRDVLPEAVRKQGFAKQVAWLQGKGAAELPEQVVWPAVERVLADGPNAVALTYPSPWPAIDPMWEHDVLEEEWAVIVALRAELGIVKEPQNLAAFFDPPESLARKPVEPLPFPKDPTPKPVHADAIDELIAVIGREQVPSADLLYRVDLSSNIAKLSALDAARAIADRLSERSPNELTERLIPRLHEVHKASVMRDVCATVFPKTIDQPGVAERLLEVWEQAFTMPWDWASRATDCLLSVSSHPLIFARMIDEIAAPDDGPLRGRTSSAFELLSAAVDRKPLALSAVVARLRRDRGRPRDVVPWRGDAMRALRKLAMEEGVPTAILELGEVASVYRAAEVFELLATHPSGIGALHQAVDLRECAREAVRDLCKSPHVGAASREKYKLHPYWKVRLMAAEKNPDTMYARREVADVWVAVDTAGFPVSSDDERYLRPDGLAKAKPDPSAPTTLPPPRDGMTSSCFDYRAWSLWAVDQLADPADAAARVFADELDIALVERGHMRCAPRWMAWRTNVPALPLDRRGRLEWARAQTDASLPPLLARVRDEGARVVAAEFPAPYLALPPELRRELEERERQVAEAGEAALS